MPVLPWGAKPSSGGGTNGQPMGLTGATAATRYVGGTTSGSPISGTFAVGDFVISEDGLVWICTVAGSPGTWVNPPTSVSTKALGLTLTTDTLYEPNSYLQGNTALLAQQNQTQDILPAVSSMSQNGTIFTIVFASSILGTLGVVGDKFQCYIQGFVPSGWNLGTVLFPVTATVTANNTITIPSTATPTVVTTTGTVTPIPVQYTDTLGTTGLAGADPGYPYPRAIIQVEGTNKFINPLSGLYGIGPAIQNAMFYTNGSKQSGTYTTATGTSTIVRSGALQPGIVVGQKIICPSVASGTTVTGISTVGGVTTITMSANYTGANVSETVFFSPDIATGEGIVNTPLVTADGTTVSFPIQSASFGAPGEGQGWGIGYWDGPVYTVTNGGLLININTINSMMNAFYTTGVTAIERVGYAVNDAVTGNNNAVNQGTLNYQYGLTIGQFGGVRTNFYPLLGGTTANVGFLNASTTIFPSAPRVAKVSGDTWIPPSGYGTVTVTVDSTTGFPATGTLNAPTTGSNPGHYTAIAYTGGGGSGTTFTGCSAPAPGFLGSDTVAQNSFTSGTSTITRVSAGSYLTDIPAVAVGNFIIDNTTGGNVQTATYVTAVTATQITTSKTLAGTATVDSLTFAPGTHVKSPMYVLNSNNYQNVGAAFNVQVNGTKMALVATASVTANTTTTITDSSPFDGKLVFLTNASSGTNYITFTSGGSTGLDLDAPTRVLAPGGSLTLLYDAPTSTWQEISFSNGNLSQGRRVTITSGSASTCTPVGDTSDIYQFQTSAGGALTVAAVTGTPQDGQQIELRIKNTGSTPTYTWNGIYRASSNLGLPSTSVASKWDRFMFEYNFTDTKWDLLAVNQGF